MGKKKGVLLPPDFPPEIGEEEVVVSEEDFEFVNSSRQYSGFLRNLDTKSIDRHVGRIADRKEDTLEAQYEKRNRQAHHQNPSQEEKLQVDPVDALPIKIDGELKYRRAKETRSNLAPKDNGAEVGEKVDDSVDKSILRLTKVERRQKLKKNRKEAKKLAKVETNVDDEEKNLHAEVLASVEKDLSFEEVFLKKKNKLAEVGISLLEDPDTNIKFLNDLMNFCNDDDKNVVKLACLSLLAVFKDIIPGYQIRLPTEKELDMNISKAVRKMRFYEYTLLMSYKAYLLRLIALEKKPFFCHVAVRCMCSLLDAVPHFNFRDSLLVSIVKNISSPDDVIRKLCCSAIKSVFANEDKHGGEATVEAVRLITNAVKIHSCHLHPDSIEVFLSLTFDDDIGRSKSMGKEKGNKSKKRRWKQINEEQKSMLGNDKKLNKKELVAKTRHEVREDLKAASFAVDSEERRRKQTETLSAIFETYFRILKHSMGSDVSRSLLAGCLRGLAKFSHLIDLDFMSDLMGCLKKLAASGDCDFNGINLKVSERMQCCIVAFKVMRNNFDALNVDLQDFFIQLYNLLLEYRPQRDQGEVLAEALKIMLCDGKQHDMQRAAAFIKRLANFSLFFGAAEAFAALVTLKLLLQKNSKCLNLLENDAGGGSLSGLVVKYQPEATEPNLSGALASVLWDLSLLAKHYNSTISSTALSVSTMSTVQTQSQVFIPTISPQQAFIDLSVGQEPFKLTGKPNLNQKKRKISSKSGRSSLSLPCMDMMNENDLMSRFQSHFTVVRSVLENERLRIERSKTQAFLDLYEDFKAQKKKRKLIETEKK